MLYHALHIVWAGAHDLLMGQPPKTARRKPHQKRKTRRECPQTGIAYIETDVRDTVLRHKQEAFCLFHTDGGEKDSRGNANHTAKNTIKVEWAQLCGVGYLWKRQLFHVSLMHRRDGPLDRPIA